MQHRRERHAAHYGSGGGHDLEVWDVAAPVRPRQPDGVPGDARYHSGYIDSNGRQHWTYTRIAELSPGDCEICRAIRRAS